MNSSKSERAVITQLRAACAELRPGDNVPAGRARRDLLAAVEYLASEQLMAGSPDWPRGDSLDGIFADHVVLTDGLGIDIRGTAILMSDQTETPIWATFEPAPDADVLARFTIHLGTPDPNTGDLLRLSLRSKSAARWRARCATQPTDIQWLFAARRGSPAPPLVTYRMPDWELRALVEVCGMPWTDLLVPGGTLLAPADGGGVTPDIGVLGIEADGLAICIGTTWADVGNAGDELFRVNCHEGDFARTLLGSSRPAVAPLTAPPAGIALGDLMTAPARRLSVLTYASPYATSGPDGRALVDEAILIETRSSQLLLRVGPVGVFQLSTDKSTIAAAARQAAEIKRLL